jgi:DNA-binding beta-propeller fold protein YncE
MSSIFNERFMHKSRYRSFPFVFLMLALCVAGSAQEKSPLQLILTIDLPGLKGRIDHMDVDAKGKRLFIAGLENGSLEVVDLRSGKWKRSIPGFQKPQGILYAVDLNKLFVASGDDAMVRVFSGDTLELLDSIKLEPGPNRVAYDSRAKVLYVGYGGRDAGKNYGEIGIIDARSDKHIGDIQVKAHPAEILLDDAKQQLFVLLPAENQIQIIDTKKREVITTWPVSSQKPGDAAFDEVHDRLLIGTRTPPQMIAMDSRSGKEVANLPTIDGQDGVYFDSAHKRVYVSGGRGEETGSVFVYHQKDADHYEIIGKIPTRPGAGTSFFSPQLNRYYVAAPAHGDQAASILVFEPQP